MIGVPRNLTILRFGGIPLSCGEPSLVARWLVDRALASDERTLVSHINANNYYYLHQSVALREHLIRVGTLLSDGIGMKLATLLHGHGNLPDLNGTDLFPLVMEYGRRRGLRIFLLGGREGVVQRARSNIETRFPGVVVVGHSNGYFSSAEERNVLNAIRTSAPHVLLLGLGFPKQEEFSLRLQREFMVPLVWNVGGLFDFVSGAKPRAPRLVRRMKLEWLYRFLLEPQVMWHRNLVVMPWFIFHILRSRLKRLTASG
jgi:N-acetylglucosaminyldiphosphoundecaprenol N-acetyl-beta-D-mannosaminyltransferase